MKVQRVGVCKSCSPRKQHVTKMTRGQQEKPTGEARPDVWWVLQLQGTRARPGPAPHWPRTSPERCPEDKPLLGVLGRARPPRLAAHRWPRRPAQPVTGTGTFSPPLRAAAQGSWGEAGTLDEHGAAGERQRAARCGPVARACAHAEAVGRRTHERRAHGSVCTEDRVQDAPPAAGIVPPQGPRGGRAPGAVSLPSLFPQQPSS